MSSPDDDRETLADDILRGASAIAYFLHGKDDPKTRRKIYSLDRKAYGIFCEGKILVARKSTIRRKIAERE